MKRSVLMASLRLFSQILLLELILRFYFDIGERPLYQVDVNCEYKVQANLQISRFHNVYTTNSYGMRSPEVSTKDEKRILLFGDSVLNGGSKIDQEDLMSYVLSDQLNAHFKEQIGVYNISAGSWGPENAYQFLTHYIDFKFDAIVLVFSSHDYHDNMHFRDVVGVIPSWPGKQPLWAIGDLYRNYLIPQINARFGTYYDYLEGFDDSAVNPGWELFNKYAIEQEIPLIVYQHAEQDELSAGEWTDYGKELSAYLRASSIPTVRAMNSEKSSFYIDNIHMNKAGHLSMANEIYSKIISEGIFGE